MFFLNKKYEKGTKGFILVETIVSVAIFSVVMTVGIGSLLSMVMANRRSQYFKITINNISLAMESMSKEMRVGYGYNCGSASGGDCGAGASSFYFTTKDGEEMIYRLQNSEIQRSLNGSPFISITSPDVVIDGLTFYTFGSSNSDNYQPKVIITIQGHTGERIKDIISFNLQTTVSQRILDF